jgi:adenylate cyclase
MFKRFLTSKAFQFFSLFIVVLLLSILCFLNFGLRDRLQFIAFDTLNKVDPREATDQIMIVDIDEETLNQLGQWPLPRDILADLVTSMKSYGTTATVFDIVFAESDRASPHLVSPELQNNDQIFANAIDSAGNVVMGFVAAREGQTRRMPHVTKPVKIRRNDRAVLTDTLFSPRGMATNLPEFPKAAAGNGIFLATPSRDGIIRKIPLLVEFEKTIYPSLSLESLRVARDPREFLKVGASKTTGLTNEYEIRIGEGDLKVPMERDGMIWVKYRSMDRETDYLSAYKILDPQYADEVREKLNGKIALIGTSAEGLKDIRSTPLNIFIPGVEVHANVIEQIIQGDYLYRYDMIADNIEALFILSIGLILVISSLFLGAVALTLTSFIAMGFAMGASYYFYIYHGLLFDPVYPSAAIGVIYILSLIMNYIRTEAQAKEIRGAFGLYISPDFMEELTDNPDKLKLGGEMRELSVMFTDIRNFTTISEQLTPEELINTMNDFLTPMSDVVMNTRGTIDKYMGDAMMAFWNAPLDDENHARHAVDAALRMTHALNPVNRALAEKAKKEGKIPLVLAAGIGVNTGLCSVGNMGSKQRFAYSALGDAVNLASRLEGQTKSYGLELLIGEDTVRQVMDFAVIEIDKIQVKGKTKPVRIYTVLGDAKIGRSKKFREFRIAHKRFLRDYRAQQFEDAATRLQDMMITSYGQDLKAYYIIMMDRMEAFQNNPPARDWDGVFVATSK